MTRQRPLGLGTHIFVSDADAAVAFYTEAFGAAELIRHCLPDGRVLFVELAVGPGWVAADEITPQDRVVVWISGVALAVNKKTFA